MKVVFRDEAIRQLKRMPVYAQRIIVEAIRRHLAEADPLAQDRNKFRLRRESTYYDFELRVREWRVFYRVNDKIYIELIGKKKGSRLLVGGKEFKL